MSKTIRAFVLRVPRLNMRTKRRKKKALKSGKILMIKTVNDAGDMWDKKIKNGRQTRTQELTELLNCRNEMTENEFQKLVEDFYQRRLNDSLTN